MSFNLKKYQSTGYKENHPNTTTEKQLVQKNKKEKEPNVVMQKQLEKNHVPEKNQTLESQLEKVRVGSSDRLVESLLDGNSGNFEIKHRNPEAHTGDVGKLEEKRLSSNPVEDEKYESLSETKKELRWWEKSNGKNGLKIANKKKD